MSKVKKSRLCKNCRSAIKKLEDGRCSALEFVDKDDIKGATLELNFAIIAAIKILNGKCQNKVIDNFISLLLRRGYYPVAPECAGEGAQLIDGQWYMPRWGCDTLQHVIEEHGDEFVNEVSEV